MLVNVLSSIICSQFEHTLGISSKYRLSGGGRFSASDKAMSIKFSLHPDFSKEEGYRNLELLIFGDGSNYISVFARLDWTVIRHEWLHPSGDGLKNGYDYIQGQTPWVVYGCHDSCWRDSVRTLVNEFGNRISTIDHIFNETGWYKEVPIDPETAKKLRQLVRDRYDSREEPKKLSEMEFKFEEKKVESK